MVGRIRYGKSGPHHGWRVGQKQSGSSNKYQPKLMPFGAREQIVQQRGTLTRRLKKLRVTLPTINMPTGEDDG